MYLYYSKGEKDEMEFQLSRRATKISAFSAVFVVFTAFILLSPIFAAGEVNASVSVSNVPPFQPTSVSTTRYVHATGQPNYAFTRGDDNNKDTVRTIINVGTAAYGGTECANQATETSWQTPASATNLNTITVSPSICSFTYSVSNVANSTKDYFYSMSTNDSSGQANSWNQTYQLNFTITMYNDRPSAPSGLNFTETIPTHSLTNPTLSFTAGTDPEDAVTQWINVSSVQGGALDVLARTSISSPYTIAGANLWSSFANTGNNTTTMRTRYWYSLYTNDGTDSGGLLSGNANSSTTVGSFNVTDWKPLTGQGSVNSSAAVPTIEGESVKFTVTWWDLDGDTTPGSTSLYICPSNAFCNSGTARCYNNSLLVGPANNATCQYVTSASDAATSYGYAFLVDSQRVWTDTGNSSTITYYVDKGIQINNFTIGKQDSTGWVGGPFENNEKVNCSAVIASPDGYITDVRISLNGPGAHSYAYDYLSGNISYTGCAGASWTTGKNCSYVFTLDGAGTNQFAEACRHKKGAWQCVVNATNQFAQNKTSGNAAGLQQTLANSAPIFEPATLINVGGTNNFTIYANSYSDPSFSMWLNVSYRDRNGWQDVNATSCGSNNNCQVHCWAGWGADTNATSIDGYWNFTNKSYGGVDNVARTTSGCSDGGNGTSTVDFLTSWESQSVNGSWSCVARVNDVANAWTFSTINNTLGGSENSAWTIFDSTPSSINFVTYAFGTVTPGNRYSATIPVSNGNYGEYRDMGNGFSSIRYNASNFTKGGDPSVFIGIQNMTIGASAANNIDCNNVALNSSCRPMNTTKLLVLGLNATYQDPIGNWTAGGNKRYVDAAMYIPIGTPVGSYNTTFQAWYCQASNTISCIDGG
jgi:hypothetical protein